MKKLQAGKRHFYQFDQFPEEGLLNFCSSKSGWGGDGNCRFTGDSPTIFADYRSELAESLGLQEKQFVFPRQTHSNNVAVVREATTEADIPDTDALITDVPGLCICVQTADCVPVLLYDPKQRVVAAIHAGWRGTVGKIVAKTVEMMQDQFQSKAENLLAGIGPSISAPNYEVSEDVIQQVKNEFSNHEALLTASGNNGKAYLDLWHANKSLLLEMGVPSQQIEVMGFCSFGEKDEFYSARREGAETGRMVCGIILF
ncbi:peptidoglycan editing factor PgeF [Mangrovibacterium lignilyticum]|uniref:peptidoglycan editing factor PgeF n=1 Tax=Mangrovibacterium lignilyticum TaxID=2668052 RepID=UPI0013D60686|nr:peptidoglycan editing factor PgeF [Mangrovibacterium lignilyticum]